MTGLRILALDVATATGAAFGGSRDTPRFWTINLGASASHEGARYAQLFIDVRRIIDANQPDLLALEAPLAAGGGGKSNRAQLAMGLRGCVMAAAFMAGVPVKQAHAASIRKHFIGHGRLPRKDAKRATIGRCWQLGWKAQNDNEADALAIFDFFASRDGRLSGPLFDQMTTSGGNP